MVKVFPAKPLPRYMLSWVSIQIQETGGVFHVPDILEGILETWFAQDYPTNKNNRYHFLSYYVPHTV